MLLGSTNVFFNKILVDIALLLSVSAIHQWDLVSHAELGGRD